ncbi:hypothetical protein Tco_0786488 [Tanacetum coccineum]
MHPIPFPRYHILGTINAIGTFVEIVMNLPPKAFFVSVIPDINCSRKLRPKPRTITSPRHVSNARKFESELSSSSQHLLRLRCCRRPRTNQPRGRMIFLPFVFLFDGFLLVVVVVVKICSGVIWGKYCGAKGNWPVNWPDGNWEELPIEFCKDGVDGFEDDD